ncbi:MAG: Tim44/TimA family putative adaptor protein [Emcibacter sp.]|nr:Tim44/TimA family putative adaptor protein [Emcibacter sp.]
MQTESESFELIIILALVAVFILFQLRRTLGKKTGYDPMDDKLNSEKNKPNSRYNDQQGKEDDNVIPLRQDQEKPASIVNLGLPKSSPFYDIIEKINFMDSSFHLRAFYDGAEQAYRLILDSFWSKDKKNLRSMLSRQVFDQFEGAISNLEQQKLHHDNKIMDIEKIDLVEATLTGSMAEITLEFTSHMIMATRDSDDKIVEGNDKKTIKIKDIWTFCRDVKSIDPNWTLIATRTG